MKFLTQVVKRFFSMSNIEVVQIPLCVIYLPFEDPVCQRFWTYVRNRHRALLNAIRRFCFFVTTREELERLFPEIYLQVYELDFDYYTLESIVKISYPFIWLKHFGVKPLIFIRGDDHEFSLKCEELLHLIYLNAMHEGIYRPR